MRNFKNFQAAKVPSPHKLNFQVEGQQAGCTALAAAVGPGVLWVPQSTQNKITISVVAGDSPFVLTMTRGSALV